MPVIQNVFSWAVVSFQNGGNYLVEGMQGFGTWSWDALTAVGSYINIVSKI